MSCHQHSSKEGKEFYTYFHVLQTEIEYYPSSTKIVEKLGTWMSLLAFLGLLGLSDITDQSCTCPNEWIVPLIPIHTCQISKILLLSILADLQALASSNPRVSRPRTTEDNIMFTVKEVGFEELDLLAMS